MEGPDPHHDQTPDITQPISAPLDSTSVSKPNSNRIGQLNNSHLIPGASQDSENVSEKVPRSDEGGDDEDEASLDSGWTEATLVPRRNLGFIQCSALMINQMIGTGVFTTPGYVLLLTKSKPIALVLWLVGGIYSLLRSVARALA
jgi:hypothetical protein